jgi:hypothetical protein
LLAGATGADPDSYTDPRADPGLGLPAVAVQALCPAGPTDPFGYAQGKPDADSHTNPDADLYNNPDANSHTDADPHNNPDANSHTDADGHVHSHPDTDTDVPSDGHPNRYAIPDGHIRPPACPLAALAGRGAWRDRPPVGPHQ